MTLDTRTPRVAALGAWNSQMLDAVANTPKAPPAQGNHHHRVATDLDERRRRRQAEARAGGLDAAKMMRVTADMSMNQRRRDWVRHG